MPEPCRFLDCTLVPAARELRRGGVLRVLSPKVFDTLVYLVDHRERAVGRDELIAAVWGRTDVSDSVLAQTISKARHAIGDTGEDQRAIRTVPRFGFRWVADTERLGAARDAPPDRPAPTAPPDSAAARPESPGGARGSRRPWILGVAVAALALVAGALALLPRADQAAGGGHASASVGGPDAAGALAVLPVDIANAGDQQWLRLGLMDLVAERLRDAGQAVVPSSNVVALDTGAQAPSARTVREATGAAWVLRPYATRDGRGWRVRLELEAPDHPALGVEAHADDPVAATRAASADLARALGLRPRHDAAHDAQITVLQQVEAALLVDDLDTARDLLDGTAPALRDSPQARFRRAQIDFRAGDYALARRRFAALLDEVDAERDAVLRARVLNGLAVIAVGEARGQDAERGFAAGLELLREEAVPAVAGQLRTGLGVAYAMQGRLDAAMVEFARARVELERAGDALALVRVDANEAVADTRRDRYADAVPVYERAMQRLERFGVRNERALILGNLIDARLELLEPSAALELSERGWPLLAQLENQDTRAILRTHRARALAANGRLTEAAALLQALEAEIDPARSARQLALVRGERAALARRMGDHDAAATLAAAAVQAMSAPDDVRPRARAWLVRVQALLAVGDSAGADQDAERFARWAAHSGQPAALLRARLAAAAVARERGATAAAEQALADALRTADRHRVPADVAEAAVAYGHALIDAGRLDTAQAVVGRVARWTEGDYDSALLQARLYHALGEAEPLRAALARTRLLAGERPVSLEDRPVPPEAGARRAAVLDDNPGDAPRRLP